MGERKESCLRGREAIARGSLRLDRCMNDTQYGVESCVEQLVCSLPWGRCIIRSRAVAFEQCLAVS